MTDLKIWFKKNYLYLAALALLVFVAYGSSLNNGFVADDVPGILNNQDITKTEYILSGGPSGMVNHALHAGITKIAGRTPLAFRTVNILFHLGNTLLTYLLLCVLLEPTVAFFTATIMAVHPIQIEAVTWISGGAYSRYSFFTLLALILYALSDKNKKLYFASLGSFLVALLVAEKAVAFPLILVTIEVACQSIGKNWRRLILPFIFSGMWTLVFLGQMGRRVTDLQTMYSQTPKTTNPLIQVPIAITSYLKLIFWPKDLTLYHSELGFTPVEFTLRLGIFVGFLGLVTYTYKKSKPVFFWLSFFVIALLPTLTPFGVSWVVAERYVYLGSLGIFVVVAMGIQKAGKKLNNSYVPYAILIPILLALTARTITRNADWKNQDTLWLAAAKISPSSPQNHNNLGDLYGRRGDLERSAEEFKKAIELNPGYADAYHNLANTYQQMGQTDLAVENYQKATEFNPNLWQSYQNLAAIYFELEEFELAKEWMEKAVKANPENTNLRLNLEIINRQLPTP